MGLSSIVQAVLQLAVLAVLARLVEPQDFGLVAGALIAVNFTAVLADSGVGAALIQRRELTRNHVRVGFTLSVLLGVTCWAVLTLLSPEIEAFLRLPGLASILAVLAVVFVVNSLSMGNFLLARRMDFARLAIAETLAYAVGYGGMAIAFAVAGFGPWSIVAGHLGQAVVLFVLVTCFAPHSVVPSLRRGPLRDLLAFGGGYSIGRIALFASSQVDNVVVGRYLGAQALGFYGRAYQLVQTPANLLGQLANEVLFPAMAAVQDRRPVLRSVFLAGMGVLAAVALPLSLVAAVTADGLVRLLLGAEWLPLSAAFTVIVFGLVFRTSSKLTDALAKATGAVYRRAWRGIVFALLVFAGAFAGQEHGLRGVAIGVLAAMGVNYMLTCHLALALVSARWRDLARAYRAAAAFSVACGSSALLAERVLTTAGLGAVARLPVVWTLALAAALLLLRLAGRVPFLECVRDLVRDVLSYLPGRLTRTAMRFLGPGYGPPPPDRERPAPVGDAT
jgi:PST family polysaccharide transporter